MERFQYGNRNLRVSFRTWEKNLYMVAESGGGSWVNADRPGPGPWETFTLIDHDGSCVEDGDWVSFGTDNGVNYLQAGNGGGYELNGWGTAPESWESFQIFRINGYFPIQHDDEVALRTATQAHYVVAEDGGGREVNANRTAIGAWEKWRVYIH